MKNNKAIFYYALIGVLVVLIGISSFFLFYFYNLRGEDLSLEDLGVSETNKISYNVKLKDSDFYKSNIEKTSYVTSMIDHINVFFNFNEAFSSSVEGEYSYYIVGNVVMDDVGDRVNTVIYKTEPVKYGVKGNVINLTNEYKINVNEVIDDYKRFLSENDINVDSYLQYKVIFNYSVYSNKIKRTVTDEKELNIIIPIKDITSISKSDDYEKVKYEFSDLNNDDDKLYSIISLEFFGAILIFTLLILLIIERLLGRESIYDYEVRKLLEKYKENVVVLKELPDLSNYNILFVEDFEDILDAAYTVSSPINYYEVVEHKQSTFIVFDQNIVYVYKIDSKNI